MIFRFRCSLLLLSLLMISLSAFAQSAHQQRKEILRELSSNTSGGGRVAVYEDESILHVLGRPMAPPRTVYSNAEGTTHFYKVRGFKIQAFSGNDQRTSKNEALRKQQQINRVYPQYETVVLFESPFWRLRVGNFENRSEAETVLEEMKKSFPSFGKEMYIVVDEVKIPVSHRSDSE